MSSITPTQALELQHGQLVFNQTPLGLNIWEQLNGALDAPTCREAEAHLLQIAPTYVINDEMCQLAIHAAKSMPAVPFTFKDLPNRAGFCLFKTPVHISVRDRSLALAGFSWYVTAIDDHDASPGVYWVFYSNVQESVHFYGEGIRKHPATPPLLPTTSHFEAFGDDVKIIDAHTSLYTRSLPLCLFSLMNQTLVKTTEERPDRAARRRLKKAGSKLATKTVKVVKLRRINPRGHHCDEESQPVEWSHRWVVNGHWRKQPTNDGVKRIWIMPFVKGPEDKPLVLKETVHVLAR